MIMPTVAKHLVGAGLSLPFTARWTQQSRITSRDGVFVDWTMMAEKAPISSYRPGPERKRGQKL
jgi:hypothetical protein